MKTVPPGGIQLFSCKEEGENHQSATCKLCRSSSNRTCKKGPPSSGGLLLSYHKNKFLQVFCAVFVKFVKLRLKLLVKTVSDAAFGRIQLSLLHFLTRSPRAELTRVPSQTVPALWRLPLSARRWQPFL